ncbi:uncharacterized protein LOC132611792 [Lycium barbarum]|uniref:uncharacterized protein LOC132611792 n=1 Tax=Lycium barbarum TaxID=112863 RepID=UPI00293F6F65|nr:uncharacterized protein LOC132611792 [Lycium barbarum]
MDGCFRVIGYPDWWPGNKKEDEKPEEEDEDNNNRVVDQDPIMEEVETRTVDTGGTRLHNLSDEIRKTVILMLNSQRINPNRKMDSKIENSSWIIDSGATNHVTGNPEELSNKQDIPMCPVPCNNYHRNRTKNFSEGMKEEHWKTTTHQEIQALEDNGTWTLETMPPDKKALRCRWVYKIRYNSDGKIERYKARLVIFGNKLEEGIDYNKKFSSAAKVVTIWTFLAIATARN